MFLGFWALMMLPQLHLSAQKLNDTIPKKSLFKRIQSHAIKPATSDTYKGQASKNLYLDTIPKKGRTSDGPPVNTTPDDTKEPGNNQKYPRDNNEDTRNQPPIIIPPGTKEIHEFVRTVLRREKIFPNKDALALIQLLNPGISNMDSVKSDYQLVLPIFPEPDPREERTVKKAFKDDLEPDASTNNLFSGAVYSLGTLTNIFASTDFVLVEKADIQNY